MKIKELLYKTPEMTEERLLEIIKENLKLITQRNPSLIRRIQQIHKHSDSVENLLLKEYDLIQEKQSYLTRSQRNEVIGFVGFCIISMTRKDEEQENSDDAIQEAEIVGDDSDSGENV